MLVDHSLDDALLTAYLDQNKNAEGKYAYQFRYLDLVDTHNGNAYVTMADGQKMNIYWPVPADAKEDSEFHIVHFKGLDRESNADINDLLTTRIPEDEECETAVIDGKKFVKFTVDSFSPFALLYEKESGTTDTPGTPDKPGTTDKPGTIDPTKPASPSNANKQTPSNSSRSDSSDDSDDSGSSTNSRKSRTVTTNETGTTTETTETSSQEETQTQTDTVTETLQENSTSDESSIDSTPKTGDESMTWMNLILMEGSLIGMIALIIMRRKKQSKE